MNPLLSIVIANYNYGLFLEEAIQSILSQGMGDKVEIIICDAASTDNSVEIIKKYANGLPPNTSYSDYHLETNDQSLATKITWWCSEPDGGQSAAFNKGFSHAHGQFLTWLNADDILLPGVVKSLEKAVAVHPDCEWFVGGVMWLDKELRVIKCGRGRSFSKLRANMGSLGVWGPSAFFSQNLLSCAGGVDEGMNYAMDTDLWMKFYYKCGVAYLPICDYAWGLRIHEKAKTSSHFFADNGAEQRKLDEIHEEMAQILERYNPPARHSFFRLLLSTNIYGALMSRFDAFRLLGHCYETYFKRGTNDI